MARTPSLAKLSVWASLAASALGCTGPTTPGSNVPDGAATQSDTGPQEAAAGSGQVKMPAQHLQGGARLVMAIEHLAPQPVEAGLARRIQG